MHRQNCTRCRDLEEQIIQMRDALVGTVRETCDVKYLTPAELRLYQCLLNHIGHDVARERLEHVIKSLYSILLPNRDECSKILDVVVHRVRKKMLASNSPYRIVTIYNYGFRLERKPERVARITSR